MTRSFSLSFLTTFDLGPVDAVRAAAKAGYQFVGLRFLPAATSDPIPEIMTNDAVLRETRDVLESTGVALADVELVRIKADTRIADFEPLLARAAILSPRHLLVVVDDANESSASDRFAALCQLCARYQITADLEFMPATGAPTLAAAERIVMAAGESNGAVLVDALHLHRSGGDVESVAKIPADRLNYVQFCDAPRTFRSTPAELVHVARNARLVPGAGELDLTGLAKACAATTLISVEVPNRAWAETVNGYDRARLALEATRQIFAAVNY